jgi:hypothetical protein
VDIAALVIVLTAQNINLTPAHRFSIIPDTAGEMPVKAERGDGQHVGARFIAPDGVEWPTPEAEHPIRYQYPSG